MLEANKGSVASESALLTYIKAAVFTYQSTTVVNNSQVNYKRVMYPTFVQTISSSSR